MTAVKHRTITAHGVVYTPRELADQIGATVDVIRHRMARGWSGERILATAPVYYKSSWDMPLREDVTARAAVSVAEESGGLAPDVISEVMGLSRQRINTIERKALRKIEATAPELREYLEARIERENRKCA